MTDDLSTRLLEAIGEMERSAPHAASWSDDVLAFCQAHREIVEMWRRDVRNESPDRWVLAEVIELLATAYGIQEET